jgi:hypothetical protein
MPAALITWNDDLVADLRSRFAAEDAARQQALLPHQPDERDLPVAAVERSPQMRRGCSAGRPRPCFMTACRIAPSMRGSHSGMHHTDNANACNSFRRDPLLIQAKKLLFRASPHTRR